ncbi:hypothetical protein CB1_000293029 [Camelus ferus]|nr:hypothetical protein CB1_000293029 [Camelus ferus]
MFLSLETALPQQTPLPVQGNVETLPFPRAEQHTGFVIFNFQGTTLLMAIRLAAMPCYLHFGCGSSLRL